MNARTSERSSGALEPGRAGISVLVISHTDGVWGAQRRLLDLAPLLAEQGVRLTLACPAGELSQRWVAAGYDHQVLELPPHRGIRRPGSRRRPGVIALSSELIAVARSAATIARRARAFDVVQSHSLWAHLETALAGRCARRPVLLDLHDIVDEGAGRSVLGLAARLATLTLANSAATASTVPRAAAKTRIVHPGVDVTRFHPGPADPRIRAELTADPGAPLIAIIGRIDPNKGVEVVVDAIARFDPSRAVPHLAVVGREHIGASDHASGLRRRAEQALGVRVRFLPPRDDVPDVMRAVDVVVNASRHEPFGRTILEAQACGVPVVGTNAGGIPEFVAEGETGLLVPPFDVGAMERALSSLLTDPVLRDRLSRQGAEQARRQFSLRAQASAAAEAYRYAVAI